MNHQTIAALPVARGARGRRNVRRGSAALVTLTAIALLALPGRADPIRHPLPNGATFPIAQAVEVPAGETLVFVSGTTPSPADAKAEPNTPAYWGNTQAQASAVFTRMQATLAGLGLGFGDVVSMTVYLVGDPALGGRMDFAGFMAAYSQYFGTAAQPRLPARSTVQVAGLVQPGMLVEVEVTAVRPTNAPAAVAHP